MAPRRSCYTAGGYPKRRFETRREAKEVARAMNEKQAERVHGYRCVICGWFHVGHDK